VEQLVSRGLRWRAGREATIPDGARMEAAWQQPAFSEETIEADSWTAVFLPIPEKANLELLLVARVFRHCLWLIKAL